MSARSTRANAANAKARKEKSDSQGSSQAAAPAVDTAKSDVAMIAAARTRLPATGVAGLGMVTAR